MQSDSTTTPEAPTAEPQEAPQAPQATPPGVGPLPPPQMRESKRLQGIPDQPPMSGRDAVKHIEHDGATLSPENIASATDWFLSPEPEDDEQTTRTIEINVGTRAPHWISWTVQSVDLDVLRKIRRESQGNRAARRAGAEMDEIEANMRIIVEGTVDPPLAEIAASKGVREPVDVLRDRFKKKPGLLGQISAEIFDLSGYNDEDVREATAGKG